MLPVPIIHLSGPFLPLALGAPGASRQPVEPGPAETVQQS